MYGSMPEWITSTKRRNRVLLVGGLLIAFILLVRATWAALVPFFLGMILAYLFLPLVNWLDLHAPHVLQRWRLSRPLSIVVVYLLGIGLVAGILIVFIPAVIDQASYLMDATPGLFRRVEGLLSHDLVELLDRIPPDIQDAVNANVQRAAEAVIGAIQAGVGVTVRTLFQTVSFVIGMVIVPFWLFYVLNDQPRIRSWFYAMLPIEARDDVRCILMIVDRLLSAYVRGQVLLCVAVGAMSTVALVILGIPQPLILGTVAGITEAIPYIGPLLGAVIPVLIALSIDPMLAVWVAVAFFVVQQTESLLLVPRIAGHAVRFHPAAVMIIVVVGAELAGIWGLLLALPVAAVVRDVSRYLYFRTTPRGATPEMAFETLRFSGL